MDLKDLGSGTLSQKTTDNKAGRGTRVREFQNQCHESNLTPLKWLWRETPMTFVGVCVPVDVLVMKKNDFPH